MCAYAILKWAAAPLCCRIHCFECFTACDRFRAASGGRNWHIGNRKLQFYACLSAFVGLGRSIDYITHAEEWKPLNNAGLNVRIETRSVNKGKSWKEYARVRGIRDRKSAISHRKNAIPLHVVGQRRSLRGRRCRCRGCCLRWTPQASHSGESFGEGMRPDEVACLRAKVFSALEKRPSTVFQTL